MKGINSVLVTGSNRGIGLELIRQLCSGGSAPKFIFAACRNPSNAQELQKLAKENPSLHVIGLEIGKEDTHKTAYEEVNKCVGDSGLDVLINNAAIYDRTTLGTVTASDLITKFEINTIGPFFIAETFLPLLRKAASKQNKMHKQAIVNISTFTSSLTTRPAPGHSYAYKISKAGLNSVTVQLADDLRSEGIIVIAQCPGWVQTDMGGRAATLTPTQSATGILTVLRKLSMEDTGKFFNYAEKILQW